MGVGNRNKEGQEQRKLQEPKRQEKYKIHGLNIWTSTVNINGFNPPDKDFQTKFFKNILLCAIYKTYNYRLSIPNPKLPNLKCSKIQNFLSTNMTPQWENSTHESCDKPNQNTGTLKILNKISSRICVHMRHKWLLRLELDLIPKISQYLRKYSKIQKIQNPINFHPKHFRWGILNPYKNIQV